MRSSAKPLLILGILYLMGIGYAATYAVFTHPGDLVHPSYTAWYLLLHGSAIFLENLFAFHGAGIILAFSLFLAVGDLGGVGTSLFAGAKTTVIVTLLAALLYTLGVTWLVPGARREMSDLIHQTELAEELRSDAELYEESGRYALAVAALQGYARLVGETEELELRIQDMRGRADEAALAQERSDRREESERILRGEERELGPAELVGLAREYFQEGDYYSAHYYADLAVRLSDGERPDARRLASRAWERITSYALSTAEESQSDYFRRKRAAYEAFQAGRSSEESLIDAYYRLRALRRERPGDPDVQRYLTLTLERLRELVLGEIEKV